MVLLLLFYIHSKGKDLIIPCCTLSSCYIALEVLEKRGCSNSTCVLKVYIGGIFVLYTTTYLHTIPETNHTYSSK